jgi:hypothetical protein
VSGLLKIGRVATSVDSLADASEAYCDARDASGKGASSFPEGELMLDGVAYRISYNGKIWHGWRPWQAGDVPAFNPYATGAA